MESFDAGNILAQEEIARHSTDIFAVLTAFENDMPEMVSDILLDVMREGEENTFEFMIVALTAMRGLVLGVCSLTGRTVDDFLGDAAGRSAITITEAEAARREGLI